MKTLTFVAVVSLLIFLALSRAFDSVQAQSKASNVQTENLVNSIN